MIQVCISYDSSMRQVSVIDDHKVGLTDWREDLLTERKYTSIRGNIAGVCERLNAI